MAKPYNKITVFIKLPFEYKAFYISLVISIIALIISIVALIL